MNDYVKFMCCEHCLTEGVYDDPELHDEHGRNAHYGACTERGCRQGNQVTGAKS